MILMVNTRELRLSAPLVLYLITPSTGRRYWKESGIVFEKTKASFALPYEQCENESVDTLIRPKTSPCNSF